MIKALAFIHKKNDFSDNDFKDYYNSFYHKLKFMPVQLTKNILNKQIQMPVAFQYIIQNVVGNFNFSRCEWLER